MIPRGVPMKAPPIATFAPPMIDEGPIGPVSPVGPAGPVAFDVDIFDQRGASADRDFTVVVYDNGLA